MKRYIKHSFLTFILVFSVNSYSQTRVKAMFYNLLNYGDDIESQNKTQDLKNILDEVAPDLFMVCELETETASNYLFTNAIEASNAQFEKANFEDSGTSLNQMVYYNTSKLILESSEAIPTNLRDINHYTFRFNTENADVNPIRVEVYVTHLKASRGAENRQRRLESIEDFITNINSLPSDSHVIFAGDFNFYTSNEEGYGSLVDENNSIVIVDPINRPCPEFPNNGIDYFDPNNYNSTYFWNNSSFADVHSQSTRTSGGSGAGGGMDDRFDFIMMSENFTTSSNLFYVQDTYKTIGNNGNCYNSFVSNTTCTGTYSQSLRENLLNFSDHLPIVMEIETPENILSVDSFNNPVVFLGSNLVSSQLNLTLKNQNIKTLQIYNQLGQLVNVVSLDSNNFNQQYSLDVSYLAQGLYFIKTNVNFKPLKFIKK